MYTPDGIMGSTLILCYLSEVVVLKTGECCSIFRMQAVGHAHWRARMGRRQRFLGLWVQFCRGRNGRRIRSVGPELPTRVDVYTRTHNV